MENFVSGFNYFSLADNERLSCSIVRSKIDRIADELNDTQKFAADELSDLCSKFSAAIEAMEKLVATISKNHNIDPKKIITIDNKYGFYRE